MTTLLRDLVRLREKMIGAELACAPLVEESHPAQRASARNLLHYVALRRYDRLKVNARLGALGLSPLSETNTGLLSGIDRAISLIESLEGGIAKAGNRERAHSKGDAASRAESRSRAQGDTRIMVTLSGESASDIGTMKDLLRSGMNVLRINCARDNADLWQRLIDTLRTSEKATGRKCKVFMDLAGPKLRTGPLALGPGVLRWSPRRDRMGRVIGPARIHFVPQGSAAGSGKKDGVLLSFPSWWLSRRTVGETLRFVDARGAKRSILVKGKQRGAIISEASMTAYVAPGIRLTSDRDKSWIEIRNIVPAEEEIRLHVGDILWLTKSPIPGKDKELDEKGRVVLPARISVTLPDALSAVRVGEKVWIDDGKIGGIVRARKQERVEVEITHAGARGSLVKADRGINLPESQVRVASLTSKDREDLQFVVHRADMVGFSFIRHPDDVHDLQHELAALGGQDIGIVLKIENIYAYQRLPEILLAGMRSRNVSALIARGDLAVECGFEEIPRIQEEIFRACAAAGMPVFIATQVLEGLAQKGKPSRPEVIDASVAARADCVMLNKGPFVVDAVKLLKKIVHEYHSHHLA